MKAQLTLVAIIPASLDALLSITLSKCSSQHRDLIAVELFGVRGTLPQNKESRPKAALSMTLVAGA
jgi:hypothetical protein